MTTFLQSNLSIANITVQVTDFQGEPLQAVLFISVPQFLGAPVITAVQLATLVGNSYGLILPPSFFIDAHTIPSLGTLLIGKVATFVPSPPPPSPPPPFPPPPFPPYSQTLQPYAIMANITMIGPDYNTLSSTPGRLDSFKASLCLQLLLYLSSSIGSPPGVINLNLDCIPLGCVPGSIVSSIVVTTTTSILLTTVSPYIDSFIESPMATLGGTAFATAFKVADASSVVIYSPPPPSPPPSPPPPFPPPNLLPPSPSPNPLVPLAAASSAISPGVAGVAGVLVILALAILALFLYLYIRARAIASIIKKDPMLPALGPPKMDSKRFRLDKLPDIISAHHIGMPPALAAAPMRLLLIKSVVNWASLKVFEDLDTSADCLVIPYSQVTEEHWARTMVLTWRWGKPKPMPNPIIGFSPMSDDQWTELLELMRLGHESGMEYIWIGE